jgi:hypothetical protein
VIPAADQAVLKMSAEPLVNLLTQDVALGVRQHLDAVLQARIFPGASVEAGRQYVKAYIDFIHYVERLHEALAVPED